MVHQFRPAGTCEGSANLCRTREESRLTHEEDVVLGKVNRSRKRGRQKMMWVDVVREIRETTIERKAREWMEIREIRMMLPESRFPIDKTTMER